MLVDVAVTKPRRARRCRRPKTCTSTDITGHPAGCSGEDRRTDCAKIIYEPFAQMTSLGVCALVRVRERMTMARQTKVTGVGRSALDWAGLGDAASRLVVNGVLVVARAALSSLRSAKSLPVI